MKKIGELRDSFVELLKLDTDIRKIIIKESSFKQHLIKRNHHNVLKYYDQLVDIISVPDYVGVNPRETGMSFELVKRLEDNVLVAIKLDVKNDYFYVATMHEISELKIEQRTKNGRLVEFDKKIINGIMEL
ncbi:hypothetical protein JDW15_08985 [Aerococcaceae bacterium zg-ZJ1578]|uniref:PBECR3 domain-containing polyvalent protein n=1 Tax=Aerococcaceae bacterium zg-252 TaxID=2796928 RepID=UPI001A34E793|nr:hypothetical protein [Aerococcaceae bacterium zg-1578]